MVVAVLGDAHAHAEALEAVIGAAEAHGAQELWSLGDMVGRGPDPEPIELARDRLSDADVEWMRSRKPAARRGETQCWHGGPRNAVHEYVGAANAAGSR